MKQRVLTLGNMIRPIDISHMHMRAHVIGADYYCSGIGNLGEKVVD